jgi:hypothetical protein
METAGSSPYAQEPTTDTYPGPIESSPQPPF